MSHKRVAIKYPYISSIQYYALQKLEKEQAEVREVWQRVIDHRAHERGKLKDRAVRRMALQAKAGQCVHVGSEHEVRPLPSSLLPSAPLSPFPPGPLSPRSPALSPSRSVQRSEHQSRFLTKGGAMTGIHAGSVHARNEARGEALDRLLDRNISSGWVSDAQSTRQPCQTFRQSPSILRVPLNFQRTSKEKVERGSRED